MMRGVWTKKGGFMPYISEGSLLMRPICKEWRLPQVLTIIDLPDEESGKVQPMDPIAWAIFEAYSNIAAVLRQSDER